MRYLPIFFRIFRIVSPNHAGDLKNSYVDENRTWLLLARGLGVYDQFVTPFREYVDRVVAEEYARNGYTYEVKIKGDVHHYKWNKIPGWLARVRINRRIVRKIQGHAVRTLSELSGLPKKQVIKILGVVSFIFVQAKIKASQKGYSRAFSIFHRYGWENVIKDVVLQRLVMTGIECDRCDFGPEDHPAMLDAERALGENAPQINHLLICQHEWSRYLSEWLSTPEFASMMQLDGAASVSPTGTPSNRVQYSVEALGQLGELIQNGSLDAQFVEKCVLTHCIIALPKDLVLLKKITEGADGAKVDWRWVSAYYHRRVGVSDIRLVHDLRTISSMSFYDARKAARAGVVPEIAQITSGLGVQRVDDLIHIHHFIERFGPEGVAASIKRVGSLQKFFAFWSIRIAQPSLDPEQVYNVVESTESITKARRSLTTAKIQVPSTTKPKKRRQRPTVPSGYIEEVTTKGQQEEVERSFDLPAAIFPRENGRQWRHRFTRVGWRVTRMASGSHFRLELVDNGSTYQITVPLGTTGSVSRYTIREALIQGRVPQKEVEKIIS
ncbi:MAG: hypothetical protein A3A57_01480 [Candidatus Woykebacteria bacterium RIFCSPLOWO2_01_FULL_41_12]|uniref:Uncharacterized protein n=1 Tax=Candidatus Woykebacteria bacterium RIFCSPLOWO2_01_FULL_41_12 TaxID=1802604 RepID=A0A1G1WSS4_9BACT|nr:MAG: hypothetical protein A3A57_01480 [Candidatus Woykebacteria bacterium RIFCSPLOWO2_01_FULL_41_12]